MKSLPASNNLRNNNPSSPNTGSQSQSATRNIKTEFRETGNDRIVSGNNFLVIKGTINSLIAFVNVSFISPEKCTAN